MLLWFRKEGRRPRLAGFPSPSPKSLFPPQKSSLKAHIQLMLGDSEGGGQQNQQKGPKSSHAAQGERSQSRGLRGALRAQAAASLGTGLSPLERLSNVMTFLERLSMAEGLLGAPPALFSSEGCESNPLVWEDVAALREAKTEEL